MKRRGHRRDFLGWSLEALAAAGMMGNLPGGAGERPPVVSPRATDGDRASEPAWAERLVVTVGPREADLVGHDDRVLQAAIDLVARRGGGTVHVLPGTFVLRNAVQLAPHVRLLGSGPESVLTKIPSRSVSLAEDSDWYDQEITLRDAEGFRVGDGVVLQAKNPHDGGPTVIKRTLVARSGNRFKLDSGLRENLWLSGEPTCASLFPLLTSERTSDLVVENITLDGDAANNANFNGNYGGCIFLQDCQRVVLRNVTARNYNGDGISFQICHEVVVEDCHCHDNRDLGLHPGSGSQRPVIRGNRLERNTIGLFWCWGVKYGLAEQNRIVGNRYGISLGHNDTDNVMRGNEVRDSGEVGVLFRDENRGVDFWANRNVLEGNQIIDSGGPTGIAIDIQGKTHDVVIRGNVLRETREPSQRIGLRLGKETRDIRLAENRLEGFHTPVADLRNG